MVDASVPFNFQAEDDLNAPLLQDDKFVEFREEEGNSDFDSGVGLKVDNKVVDEYFDLSTLSAGSNGGVLVGGSQNFDQTTAGSRSSDGDLVVVDSPVVGTDRVERGEDTVAFNVDGQNFDLVRRVLDKEGLDLLVDEDVLVSVAVVFNRKDDLDLLDKDLDLDVELGVAGGGVQQGFEEDARTGEVQLEDGLSVLVLDEEGDGFQVEDVAFPFNNIGVEDEVLDLDVDLDEDFEFAPDGDQFLFVGESNIVDDFVLALVDELNPLLVDVDIGNFDADVEEVLEEKAVVFIWQQTMARSGARFFLGARAGAFIRTRSRGLIRARTRRFIRSRAGGFIGARA